MGGFLFTFPFISKCKYIISHIKDKNNFKTYLKYKIITIHLHQISIKRIKLNRNICEHYIGSYIQH